MFPLCLFSFPLCFGRIRASCVRWMPSQIRSTDLLRDCREYQIFHFLRIPFTFCFNLRHSIQVNIRCQSAFSECKVKAFTWQNFLRCHKFCFAFFFRFRSKAGHAECSIISTPHWAHMSSSPLSQVVHFVINNAAIVKEYRKSIHYGINNFAKSKSKKRKYPV